MYVFKTLKVSQQFITYVWSIVVKDFKPDARGLVQAWFLEISFVYALVCVYVSVCLCVRPEGINNQI